MSESRRRPHVALRKRTARRTSRRRWSGRDEEDRFFSDANELSVKLNAVKESVESRENKVKIYTDPNYYFVLSIRGKIYWKYINDIFNKLSLNLKNILSDNRAIFSLNKKEYENFQSKLVKYLDVIESINEVSIYHKISEEIYDEIKSNPHKINYYTIEFSALTGLDNPSELNSEITNWVTRNDGRITLNYFSTNMILYTVQIENIKLRTLAESLDSVSHIERRPSIELVNDTSFQLNFIKDELVEPTEPETLPTICIIDSGINQKHDRLKNLIEATYDFSTEDPYPCEDNVGHGTWVSGLAIYGRDPVLNNRPSAKIIMIKNFVDNTQTIMEEINAIQTVIDYFPNQFKILNLSYSSKGPNSSFTRALDKIAFDSNLIIIASAGNIHVSEILYNLNQGIPYPEYIKNFPIYYPGDCRNIITVGSCTKKNTQLAPSGSPSPFTRSGPYRNILKPDLMENGGNLDLIKGSRAVKLKGDGFGVYTISHLDSGFIEQHGSSFSSPIVSNMIAKLHSQLGLDSSVLLKALLLSSCNKLKDPNGDFYDIDLQGFGKSVFSDALTSSQHRISYLLEGRFSSRFPRLYDRYEIWFPVGANEIEVTLVCEKSETVYENERGDYISLDVFRRAGTGGRTDFFTVAGNEQCCNTYKGKYEVARGSRGSWIIDIVPIYAGGNIFPLRMRYGCVVTVKDSKRQNDIWKNVYDNWLVDRLELPIPTEEEVESTMEPLRPVLIEREINVGI